MTRPLVRLLVVGTLIITIGVGYVTFRIWQQGQTDEERHVDAIVVLGAAQYDGRPSPLFRARLDHALHLYKSGVADRLVVTGGKAAGDWTTEAAVAREYALAHRVPAKAILDEDAGRNTLESLQSVATLLRHNGLGTALFVSDRTHMLRVLRIARDLGIEAYGSPTTTSPLEYDAGRRVDATLHELGALAIYFVTGGAPSEQHPGDVSSAP
ncbi:MAG: YdcF family protein [Chloroflexota bacterium]